MNYTLYAITFVFLMALQVSFFSHFDDILALYPIGLLFSTIIAHRYHAILGSLSIIIWQIIHQLITFPQNAFWTSVVLAPIIYVLVKQVFAKRSVYAFTGLFSICLFLMQVMESILLSGGVFNIGLLLFWVTLSMLVYLGLASFDKQFILKSS